jgi:hypothetical protein
MNGRNRGLKGVRAEAMGLQGFLQQRHSLRDLLLVPERAILVPQPGFDDILKKIS